ncbi:DUF4249 domain-containing protein [Hymenobacter chitinivorans]|uniref:Uncharacterized protein DUF4249 n=1 Tax=Hymenobacter chitinivorans DSM 11115 TaxID=1121954 RepID=A0A2M9BS29_9BACT|nr:DUF4249 domain-containing protein [Hymenobacter chitinivorans]PJJ60770.1 uncharacterized protein DUF4249 [Hymenobacter chitinivorans DSM 11115]
MNSPLNLRAGLLLLCCALLLSLSGCIESFEPSGGTVTPNFLVVDGFLNSDGVTTIKLTRSLGLKAKTAPAAEAKAKLFVEEENGLRYALPETTAGTYVSARLSLNPTKRYRLFFTTANNRAYATDYTRAKLTPPIDKVSWLVEGDVVRVQVSAHDDANQTQYYRWDAEETWEFTSAYRSYYEWVGSKMKRRTQDIYRCWTTQPSGVIKLNTTTKLSQDVVADFPLLTLASSSVKLRYKYSVLVKQYAQTVEEFAYWEALRKNTENIGTLFDPLPSQLTGNVHCLTDPSEQVLGYIGAYSVQEQRLFISRDQLPASWKSDTGYETCGKPDTVEYRNAAVSFRTTNYIPLDSLEARGYTAQYADCADCRRRGTNVPPAFWK